MSFSLSAVVSILCCCYCACLPRHLRSADFFPFGAVRLLCSLTHGHPILCCPSVDDLSDRYVAVFVLKVFVLVREASKQALRYTHTSVPHIHPLAILTAAVQ